MHISRHNIQFGVCLTVKIPIITQIAAVQLIIHTHRQDYNRTETASETNISFLKIATRYVYVMLTRQFLAYGIPIPTCSNLFFEASDVPGLLQKDFMCYSTCRSTIAIWSISCGSSEFKLDLSV
jgi:hypothetical protein